MDVAQGLAGLGGRKKRNAPNCLLGIQAKNQAPKITLALPETFILKAQILQLASLSVDT